MSIDQYFWRLSSLARLPSVLEYSEYLLQETTFSIKIFGRKIKETTLARHLPKNKCASSLYVIKDGSSLSDCKNHKANKLNFKKSTG